MTSGAWLAVATKAVSTGVIVAMAAGVAELAGPFWGALAASLPVSAGPTYVFLAMEHDRNFVASSALGSFAANAATMAFLTVYARLGAGSSRVRALGPAIIVWLALAVLIQATTWSVLSASMLNLAAFAAGLHLVRHVDAGRGASTAADGRRWYDLPVRAAAVAVFVCVVVVGSTAIGPAATGIAAMFPIVFTTLMVVLHDRVGGAACASLAATAVQVMGGFSLMLLVLHLAVVPLGAVAALLLALLTTLGWSGGILLLRLRAVSAPRR